MLLLAPRITIAQTLTSQVKLSFLVLLCIGFTVAVYLAYKRYGWIPLPLFLVLGVMRDTVLTLSWVMTFYIVGRAVLRGTWLELGIALGSLIIVGTIENALEGVLTSRPPPMVGPGTPPSRWEIRRNAIVVVVFGGHVFALNHFLLASTSSLAIWVIAGISLLVMLASLLMQLERGRKYRGWFALEPGMRIDPSSGSLSRVSEVSSPSHIRDVRLAEHLESRAFVLAQQGRFYDAYDYFDQARLVYEGWNTIREAAEVWCNLGMCHRSRGNCERALELYRVAQDVFERIRDDHLETGAASKDRASRITKPVVSALVI